MPARRRAVRYGVIGEADNGREAIVLAQNLKPDVVIMDLSMPELNGLRATEELKELCPEIRILTLSRHTDDGYPQQLLQAGASGYVLKQSAADDLVRAIRIVAAGQTYLDPTVTEAVLTRVVGKRTLRSTGVGRHLSPREADVLRLIAWGYLSKEVATHLGISTKTAEAHKANAMSKLGMKNRIDIVRYAILQGWLQDT